MHCFMHEDTPPFIFRMNDSITYTCRCFRLNASFFRYRYQMPDHFCQVIIFATEK
jgi:hypothetical protein